MAATPAGRVWVLRYPTSRSLGDLVEPFRSGARGFVAELERRGCRVRITATRRSRERAHLMYWAWAIDRDGVAPEAVPADPAIPIAWTREGAREMVEAYELVHRPSRTSRHIDGRAFDGRVEGWPGTDEDLDALGADHGVHRLAGDPVHWSDDGH